MKKLIILLAVCLCLNGIVALADGNPALPGAVDAMASGDGAAQNVQPGDPSAPGADDADGGDNVEAKPPAAGQEGQQQEPGRSRFSSDAMANESTHTIGAQISDSCIVFFRPSRNIGFFQMFM